MFCNSLWYHYLSTVPIEPYIPNKSKPVNVSWSFRFSANIFIQNALAGGGEGGAKPLSTTLMHCNTVSSIVNSASSSAEFKVRVNSPRIMKSPKHSRAFFLADFWFYNFNTIGDKQYTPQNVKNKTKIHYFGTLLIRKLQSDPS